MQKEITIDKLSINQFDDITAPFELDLIAVFKLIEDKVNNMDFTGKSEYEINTMIEGLFSE